MTAFTRPKRISLKNHPLYSENWVQDIIANDPERLIPLRPVLLHVDLTGQPVKPGYGL